MFDLGNPFLLFGHPLAIQDHPHTPKFRSQSSGSAILQFEILGHHYLTKKLPKPNKRGDCGSVLCVLSRIVHSRHRSLSDTSPVITNKALALERYNRSTLKIALCQCRRVP